MIRVFPRKTKWTPNDELAFIGDPSLFRPPDQPVQISVTFTWDILEAKRLFKSWSDYYSDVQIGGPAFGDPGGEFVPGRFIKEGVTITSRGCPWRCPWCFVPDREGEIRELPIKPGWIIQDNNLLACSKSHVQAVFEMLAEQPKAIKFSGGLDARLLSDWHIRQLEKLRIDELWFACDHPTAFKALERVADLTSNFPINKKRCFVLIGFNGENIVNAESRCERVYEMGFLPFAQLYQSERKCSWPVDWKRLQRKWCRPAAYRSSTP